MSLSVNISYPKARSVYTKTFSLLRTDSNTLKCVLPKGAVILGVFVNQLTNAVTGAGSVSVGWSGSTTAILNAFSMPTSRVGFTTAGAAAGSAVGTQLTDDRQIISTYTVGSSTAGGEGYAIIVYTVPGAGESIYS